MCTHAEHAKSANNGALTACCAGTLPRMSLSSKPPVACFTRSLNARFFSRSMVLAVQSATCDNRSSQLIESTKVTYTCVHSKQTYAYSTTTHTNRCLQAHTITSPQCPVGFVSLTTKLVVYVLRPDNTILRQLFKSGSLMQIFIPTRPSWPTLSAASW